MRDPDDVLETCVLSSTVSNPSSNVEWLQTPSRNFYLFGACDGSLVLEELREGGLDRSLSLQRKFFLSPLLSPAAPITLLRVQQDRIAAASGALILTTTLRIVLAGGGRGLQPGDVRELRLPSDAAALQWTQDGEGLLVSHADGQVSMWRRGRGEAETGTPSLGRSFQDPSPFLPFHRPEDPSSPPLFHPPGGARASRPSMETAHSTPDLHARPGGSPDDGSHRGHPGASGRRAPVDEDAWHCAWRVAALGEVHRVVAAGSRASAPAASCTSYARFQPLRPAAKHVMIWWSPEADAMALPFRPPGAASLVPRGEVLRHPAPVVSAQWSPSLALASGRPPSAQSDTPLLTLTADHVIRLWVEVRGLVPGSPHTAQFCTALVIDAPVPPSLAAPSLYACQVQWAAVDPDHAEYQRSRDLLWLTAVVLPGAGRGSGLRLEGREGSEGPLQREASGASTGPGGDRSALTPQLLLWAIAGLTGVDVSGGDAPTSAAAAATHAAPAARAPRSVLWSRASLPEGMFSLAHGGTAGGEDLPLTPSYRPPPAVSLTCVGWYKDTAEGHHDLRLRVTGCVAPHPTQPYRPALHGPGAPPPPPPPVARTLTMTPPPPPQLSGPFSAVGYVPPPIVHTGVGGLGVTSPLGPPPPPPALPIGAATYVPPPLLAAPLSAPPPRLDDRPAALPRPRAPEQRSLFSITIDPARVTDGQGASPAEPAAMRFHMKRLAGHVAPVVHLATCDQFGASVDAAGNLFLWSLPDLGLLGTVSCRGLLGGGRGGGGEETAVFAPGSIKLAWAGAADADAPPLDEGPLDGPEEDDADPPRLPLAARPTLLIACPSALAYVSVRASLVNGAALEGPVPIPCPLGALASVGGGIEEAVWVRRGEEGGQGSPDPVHRSVASMSSDSDSDAEPTPGPEGEDDAAPAPRDTGRRMFQGFLLQGRGPGGVLSSLFVAWRGRVPAVRALATPPALHALCFFPAIPPSEASPALPCAPPYDLAMLTLDGRLEFATLEVPSPAGADPAAPCTCVQQLSQSILPLLSEVGAQMAQVGGLAVSALGDRIALTIRRALAVRPEGPPSRTARDSFAVVIVRLAFEGPELRLSVHQALRVRGGEEEEEGLYGDRAERSLRLEAGPSVQWFESSLLGQCLVVGSEGRVTVYRANARGRLRPTLSHRRRTRGPPSWQAEEDGEAEGPTAGANPPPTEMLWATAAPGLVLVSEFGALSLLASLPLRPAHLLRRTAANAAAVSAETVASYAADLSRAFGACLPDFHPRVLRLLVDAGRPDLSARLVRLLKVTLEQLLQGEGPGVLGRQGSAPPPPLSTIVEDRAAAEGPGRSGRSKLVILRLLEALGGELAPLESVRAAEVTAKGLRKGVAAVAAKAKVDVPKPEAPPYADPMMSGMLDMSAFGDFGGGGLGTGASAPPDEGAQEESEADSEPEEEEEDDLGVPAPPPVDTGLLDMSAFGGFGGDGFGSGSASVPIERLEWLAERLAAQGSVPDPDELETIGVVAGEGKAWVVKRRAGPGNKNCVTFSKFGSEATKIDVAIKADLLYIERLTDGGLGVQEIRNRVLNYDLNIHRDPTVARLLEGTDAPGIETIYRILSKGRHGPKRFDPQLLKERAAEAKRRRARPDADVEPMTVTDPPSSTSRSRPSPGLAVGSSVPAALAPSVLLGAEDLHALARLFVRLRLVSPEDAKPFRSGAAPRSVFEVEDEDEDEPSEDPLNPYRLSMKGSIFEEGMRARGGKAESAPPFRVLGLDAPTAKDLLAFCKAVLHLPEGAGDLLLRLDRTGRTLYFSLRALAVASLPSLRPGAGPFTPDEVAEEDEEDEEEEEWGLATRRRSLRSESVASARVFEPPAKMKTEGVGSAFFHRHGVKSLGAGALMFARSSSGPAAAGDPGTSAEQWAYWGLARGVAFRHIFLAQRSGFPADQLVEALLPLAATLDPGREEGSESATGPSSHGFALFAGGKAPPQAAARPGTTGPVDVAWPLLRRLGAGYWLTDGPTCRALAERIAQLSFAATRDPFKSTLMYVALGKKSVLQGLFRLTTTDSARKVYEFLGRNFAAEEHRTAAVKNAYALLSQHKHEIAAAFFLLGGALKDGLGVLAKELGDPQLCLFVGRLLGTEGERTARALVLQEMAPRAESDLQGGLYRDDFLLPVLEGLGAEQAPVAAIARPAALSGGAARDPAPLSAALRTLADRLVMDASSDAITRLDAAASLCVLLLGAQSASTDGPAASHGSQAAALSCALDTPTALQLHALYAALAATAQAAGLAPLALALATASHRIAAALFEAATGAGAEVTGIPDDAAALPARMALGKATAAQEGLAAARAARLHAAVAELINPSAVREILGSPASPATACLIRALSVHRDYVRMTKGLPESQQAQLLTHMLLKALGKFSAANRPPSQTHTPSASSRQLLPPAAGPTALTLAPGAVLHSPLSRSLATLATAGGPSDMEDDRESVSTHAGPRGSCGVVPAPAPLALDGSVPLFAVEGARTLLHLSRGGSASQTLHEPRVLGMSIVHAHASPPTDPAQRLSLLRQHPAATDPAAVCTSAHHGLHAVRLRAREHGGAPEAGDTWASPRGRGGAAVELGEDAGFTLISSPRSPPHPSGAGSGDSQIPKKAGSKVPALSHGPAPSMPTPPHNATHLGPPSDNGAPGGSHHQRTGSFLSIVQDVFDSLWMGGPVPDKSGASSSSDHAAPGPFDIDHLHGGDILLTTPVRSGMRRGAAVLARPSQDPGRPSTAGPSRPGTATAALGGVSRVSSESSMQDPASPRKLTRTLSDRPHVRNVGTRAVAGHPCRPVYATGAAHGAHVLLWRLGEESPFAQLHFEPPIPHQSALERLSLSRLGHGPAAHTAPHAGGPSAPSSPAPPVPRPLEGGGSGTPGHAPPPPASSQHYQQQQQQQQASLVLQMHQRLKDAHVTALAFAADGHSLAAVTSTGVVASWHLTGSFLDMSQEAAAAPARQHPPPPPMPLPQLHARWLHAPLSRGACVGFLGDTGGIVVAGGIGQGGRDLVLCKTDLPPAVSHLVSLAAHPGGCTAVATLALGLVLVSGGEGGDLSMHDLRMVEAGATPVLLWRRSLAHEAPVTCIGTGRLRGRDLLVTGSRDGAVKVWEAQRHVLLQSIELAHHVEKRSASFLSMAFARKKPGDGKGGELQHGCPVSAVALQDEGLVSAGHDGAVRLWPWSSALAAGLL